LLLGVAHAYCDEAVADAEALLKATSERAAAKEATAQDVAVVRYHLLEMKSAAGKPPQEAFCQEARRQLQEAAAADGDDETKAGLAERREKINAMTASPERCRQAAADIDAYLFGVVRTAASDDDVKQAEATAVDAQKRYKAGELDRLSATLAEARALEAPYTAGKMTREAYCASAQAAVLADLAAWVQTLAQFGQIGLLGEIAARRQFYRFKALCQAR